MHDPETGSQKEKGFDALCKFAQPSKPCYTNLSTCCPALAPHRDRNSHLSYHTDKHQCSAKCTHSCSCPCSCSHSRDCHDDVRCSQRSYCPCHDTSIGYQDVCSSGKSYLDSSNCQPISSTSVASHVSLQSSNVVFDSDLNNIEHVKKFATYPNYDDNDSHSYIGKTPNESDNTFCMGTFDIRNYTDPETKQYSNCYHTKLDAQPPAGCCQLLSSGNFLSWQWRKKAKTLHTRYQTL